MFDGEIISFDTSLVIYIYICIYNTDLPPIIIIDRVYETQSSVAVACFLPGRAKDLSAPLYKSHTHTHTRTICEQSVEFFHVIPCT